MLSIESPIRQASTTLSGGTHFFHPASSTTIEAPSPFVNALLVLALPRSKDREQLAHVLFMELPALNPRAAAEC